MREIKFRAWCYINNKMYYQHIDGMTQVNGIDGSGNSDYHVATIRFLKEITPGHDDIDLMQYTGLKDKNGKEIYEGDIVEQLVWKYVGDNLNLEEDNQFDEVYVKGKVMIYPTKGVVFVENRNVRSLRQKKCEVIGNIYENPDLLTNLKEK